MEIFRKWNSKKDSTGNGCQYWKWESQFQYWQIARLGTYIFTNKITALKGTYISSTIYLSLFSFTLSLYLADDTLL